MNESKVLADLTSSLDYVNLSPATITKTKQTILDWLGVCIRGSKEQPVKILQEVLLQGEKPEATVLKADQVRTTAMNAAFLNGAASHTLDFDDLHNASIIHLATVVIPPVFAIAEKESLSGKDMVTAVVAGYEVGARVGEAVNPESYHFWHTTGTAGSIGGGISAAKSLKLNAKQTLMCLGSIGTQAAGFWEFVKEGAMSKPLHTGKGCYAAVLSAYISQKGYTGASKILEGEKGFCLAMTPAAHMEKLSEGVEEMQQAINAGAVVKHFKIDDNSYKPYSCCKHSHASLYAVQTLQKENGFSFKDVDRVELHVNSITDSLINNPTPQTVYGCKFSIQYCVATMLKQGVVSIDQFTPEAMADADVRALMQNIQVIQKPEIQAIIDSDASKLASKVVIFLKNGTVLERLVEYPKGDPDNPMTWEESVAKFNSLVVPVYGEAVAAKLVALIGDLENCANFKEALSAALQ